MKRFEYKLIYQDYANTKNGTILDIEKFLNLLGDLSWELCAIDWGCLIFKREIVK